MLKSAESAESGNLQTYYQDRASTYDELYEVPEFANDLGDLKKWVEAHARGRTILEVAAGTGYWTEIAARDACAITAIDRNLEVLKIARKRVLGPHVHLVVADAFAIPNFAMRFDLAMAHLWWSHVRIERREEFLASLAAHLVPGATLLMIDQIFCKSLCVPAWRRDKWGNRYELRTLQSGTYEILKNYPRPEKIVSGLSRFFEGIEIQRLRYFWAVRARMRGR
jgi:ubiquinone/menaquinone biosynthesis C-methylase UbiE